MFQAVLPRTNGRRRETFRKDYRIGTARCATSATTDVGWRLNIH